MLDYGMLGEYDEDVGLFEFRPVPKDHDAVVRSKRSKWKSITHVSTHITLLGIEWDVDRPNTRQKFAPASESMSSLNTCQ